MTTSLGSIVLTNDDGIAAPGLAALVRAYVGRFGQRVIVVAPAGDRSAIGHGTTVRREIRVDSLPDSEFGDVPAYAVEGTPVDCVKLAVQILAPGPVALVSSGIKHGHNLGTDVFYSGTVSAAVEAAILGLPGLAISAPRDAATYLLDDAADIAARLGALILRKPLPARTLLNLNVPADSHGGAPSEFRLCRLGERNYRNSYQLLRQTGSARYYLLAGEDLNDDGEIGTDISVVRSGQMSLSPIHLDRTDHAVLAAMEEWLE
jgi:5'-nucleotidase